jgi:hypothetical protein
MCQPSIADSCLATVKAVGKDKVGYINMAIDLTPMCDCMGFADTPVVPNLGVFAGKDPVAIDQACLDKVSEAHGTPGSAAEDRGVAEPGKKKLEKVSPVHSGMSEEAQINTGASIGLGSKAYELLTIETPPEKFFGFSADTRPLGQRFANLYAKEAPFPRDRYDGQGFKREQEADYEKLK